MGLLLWYSHYWWELEEAEHDINYLEMLPALFALKSFEGTISGKRVKRMVDNITAVTTINQMGTCHSQANNYLAQQIWEWCIVSNVWLTVVHIPGKENTEADRESRLSRREIEWTLQKSLFKAASDKLGVTPNIDIFASRLNYQLKPYIAFQPDPEAHTINAFHMSWRYWDFYAFPPFSVIPRVLQKISVEETTGLLIVPNWATQTWWPYLMNMLIDFALLLPRKDNMLYLPAQPQLLHPLYQKLQLLVCHLSGDLHKSRGISSGPTEIIMQSWRTGTRKNTKLTMRDGENSAVHGILIPFQHL